MAFVKLILYADGGSRGNPGPAGAGVYLEDKEGKPIARLYKYLGETTNNVAEYSALILGLKQALQRESQEIVVRMDSQLVIRQLEGQYRVKEPSLQRLHQKAQELLSQFKKVQLEHIPREKNKEADKMANMAIDKALEV